MRLDHSSDLAAIAHKCQSRTASINSSSKVNLTNRFPERAQTNLILIFFLLCSAAESAEQGTTTALRVMLQPKKKEDRRNHQTMLLSNRPRTRFTDFFFFFFYTHTHRTAPALLPELVLSLSFLFITLNHRRRIKSYARHLKALVSVFLEILFFSFIAHLILIGLVS